MKRRREKEEEEEEERLQLLLGAWELGTLTSVILPSPKR